MQRELGYDMGSNAAWLVLGFDAERSTCSDLAARIEKRVSGILRVRSLRDPDVREWREQALGADNRSVATLFEVEDGKVRAWSGWRMGWVLSRAVGPAATWQVIQALREAGAAPVIEGSVFEENLPEDAGKAHLGTGRG